MIFSKTAFLKSAYGVALLLSTAIPSFASGLVYIPMGSEGNIIIVEKDGGAIKGEISGLPSVHGLGATPDGRFLIAGSNEQREQGTEAIAKPDGVSAEDHAAHHPTSDGPATPMIEPGDEISTVSIIRTSDNSIIRRIDVPGSVHHVSVSPDGRYAALTHVVNGGISVIDLNNYEIAAILPTGDLPNYAVFSPDSSRLYVSNAGNDTISIINTKRWIVERNIVVGSGPEHIALSGDGATLFVSNVGDGTISFVSLSDASVKNTISVGEIPHGLDVSDDDKTLFVAVRGENSLVSINVEAGTSNNVELGPEPYHLTNIVGSGKIYVSSAEAPTVWIIDQKTLVTEGEIPVGGKAHQMVQIDN